MKISGLFNMTLYITPFGHELWIEVKPTEIVTNGHPLL